MSEHKIDLAPDETSKAWFAGIAAASRADTFVQSMIEGAQDPDDFDAVLAAWWLHVGTSMSNHFTTQPSEIAQQRFVEGATVNAPVRPKPLVRITIDDAVADYYTDDDGNVDEDKLGMALRAILETIAGRFERQDVVTGVSPHRQGKGEPWATIEFNL